MTSHVNDRPAARIAPTRIAPARGLSAKVLALTVIFVMLGEVLIFLPSIANFRIQWLKARVAQAEIAALAAEAAPNAIVDEALRTEILKGAGVTTVSLTRDNRKQLMLRADDHEMVAQTFDLRGNFRVDTLPEALTALFRSHDRLIGIVDDPPNMSGDLIEIALHEQPLVKAMRLYGLNILWLSLVLSAIVAAMIYAALNRLLVRPMQRLSENMTAFAADPENVARVIEPSARRDELGVAEHRLRGMQTELQHMLQQKTRLAALGLAVSKVSHDLRNMLTSAQLISDRLAEVRDPNVQRFAPKLIASLDRAIGFLNQTLKYGQAQEPLPQRQHLRLEPLVRDVLESFALASIQVLELKAEVNPSVTIDADREHIARVLTNLVRNAVQAFESDPARRAPFCIEVRGWREGSVTAIEVADNGPGIPESVRDKLFEAFQSAARSDGTGLGLAISAELIAAHAGAITVKSTGPHGTIFLITVPDRPLSMAQHRASPRN
jgi:signal transduction histidine kinase